MGKGRRQSANGGGGGDHGRGRGRACSRSRWAGTGPLVGATIFRLHAPMRAQSVSTFFTRFILALLAYIVFFGVVSTVVLATGTGTAKAGGPDYFMKFIEEMGMGAGAGAGIVEGYTTAASSATEMPKSQAEADQKELAKMEGDVSKQTEELIDLIDSENDKIGVSSKKIGDARAKLKKIEEMGQKAEAAAEKEKAEGEEKIQNALDDLGGD